MLCPICGNSDDNIAHNIREMFFGTRECFTYIQCASCGCLSIDKIPGDLSRYYPDTYYSKASRSEEWKPTWKKFLKRQRMLYWLGRPNALGRLLARDANKPRFLNQLRPLNLGLDDRILDVGSGSGELLMNLAAEGFTNLIGIDPFIDNDITYTSGVKVYKKSIIEIKPFFDIIMFNHSFEHLSEPYNVLRYTRTLLAPGGRILIRIPVADSFAWHHYGVNWYQLDAPRHFITHTCKSIELVATEAGLTLFRIEHDSNEMQFWASEAYQRNVAFINALKEPRTPEMITQWREKAAELNARGEGDQACFYFTVR